MSAVRLARGATGRNKTIKCIGCYHGHADSLLVAAGSGASTLGVPSSPGVPDGAAKDTLLVGYNDLSAVEKALTEHRGEVASVIVEPVAGNMGVVPPADGYLQGLRRLCDDHGTLLILDEVMTGFRLAYGGAQQLYGVRADLTVLGKIIGGGLPVGALAGPADIMKHLSPEGPVYQAGTLSGNPTTMAAGLATLQALRAEGFYEELEQKSAALADGLREAADSAEPKVDLCLNRVGSMLSCFFGPAVVVDYADATQSNARAFAAFFHAMLDAGIHMAPSRFEAVFVSQAHSDADIDRTVQMACQAFAAAADAL